MNPRWLLLLMILLFAADRPAAAGDWFGPEPSLLNLQAGAAQIFDSRQEFYWGVEYRPAFRLVHLGPWLFFGTGRDATFYAAAGVLLDLRLGDRWVLTPSFGGGYYHAEEGLDLGFDMQFRSAIELAWRFRNGQRLGVHFAHLSNGSLSDVNPGTETLAFTWSIPLDTLCRHCQPAAAPPP
jgi:lipid A 3-O-deacylase